MRRQWCIGQYHPSGVVPLLLPSALLCPVTSHNLLLCLSEDNDTKDKDKQDNNSEDNINDKYNEDNNSEDVTSHNLLRLSEDNDTKDKDK